MTKKNRRLLFDRPKPKGEEEGGGGGGEEEEEEGGGDGMVQ